MPMQVRYLMCLSVFGFVWFYIVLLISYNVRIFSGLAGRI